MCIIVDKQGKKLLWLFFIIGLVTSLPFIIVDFIFTHGIISRNEQLCLYADISLTQQTTYNSAYHVLSVNQWCELLFVLTLLGMAVVGHFLHEKKFKTLFLVSSILGSCWCLFHLSWCIYAVNINYAIIQIENLYPNFCERISPYFSSYIGFGLIVKSTMLMLFFITPKHEGKQEKQGINPEIKNQETGNSVPSSLKSFPVESI